jgi:hypothetical protein
MMFLQPILLWALPAVLLPVLIHLLNRLRYRQVDWAAMAFLLAAARRSTHSARVRHWLLLACRMLIVLLVILALSRPQVRGRLAALAGGAPDTALLLLDRSASMETQAQDGGASRREQALAFFAQAGDGRRTAGSYVLVENVQRKPLELRHPSALQGLALCGSTDTAADIPAMLRTALDYIIKNKCGRTEILIASDLQDSNWRPQDRDWETLRAQLAGLAPDVSVLLLDLAGVGSANMALAMQDAVVRQTGDRAILNLTMDIRANESVNTDFPLLINSGGVRLQVDTTMDHAAELRFSTGVDVAGDGVPGWGLVEIPADANRRDNVSYFVHGELPAGRMAVALAEPVDALIWRAAAGRGRPMDVIAVQDAGRIKTDDLALLILQGADRVAAEHAAAFAAAGGVVLLLPPGVAGECAVMGIEWLDTERSPAGAPFRVPVWDQHDGLLSRTSGGMNLPVDGLSVTSRQRFRFTEASESGAGGRVLAQYADGGVFIEERQIGAGRLFACSTRPGSEWSSLADGTVLVPMVQRLLRLGRARLGAVQSAVCGEWRPAAADEVWLPVSGGEQDDPALHAGVYRAGARLLALNRPVAEDLPDVLNRDHVRALFGDARLLIVDGADPVVQNGRDGSEIWFLLVCLALAGVFVEGVLNREQAVARRAAGHARERRPS